MFKWLRRKLGLDRDLNVQVACYRDLEAKIDDIHKRMDRFESDNLGTTISPITRSRDYLSESVRAESDRIAAEALARMKP